MPDINYHGPVVGFDLDDTLFPERDFCRSGFNFLCNPEKYKVLDITDYPSKETLCALAREMDRELTSRRNPFDPFENFFEPLARTHNLEWDFRRHLEAYRAHVPNLSLTEEIKEVLNKLKDRGIAMAIVTDGRSVTQRCKIEALGLDEYVRPEMILISEETGHEKKESKEMFARIVRFYPEASGFYYAGNNPLKDFYHPNLMGWTTIQVPPGEDDVHVGLQPPSPLHAPGYKISKFLEIINLIS